jgi:GH24 family phage-related lysozyme (muramidase)
LITNKERFKMALSDRQQSSFASGNPDIKKALTEANSTTNTLGLGASPRPPRPKSFELNSQNKNGMDTTIAKSVSSNSNQEALISNLLGSKSLVVNNGLDNPILYNQNLGKELATVLSKTPTTPDDYYEALNSIMMGRNSTLTLSTPAKEAADAFMFERTPDQITAIQGFLGVTADGDLGKETRIAIANYTSVFGKESLVKEFPPAKIKSGSFDPLHFANNYLAKSEGTEQGITLEAGGAITLAYGITNPLGLERNNYSKGPAGDAEFAAAVADKHYQKLSNNFKNKGRSLENLPLSVQYALVDLHYNIGNVGETLKETTTKGMLKNTLDFVGMTTKDGKTEASLLSLATRRAENWNRASGDADLTRITKIQHIPTKKGTTMRYLAKDGSIVHETNNGRTAVTVNKDASYTKLTEMREENIK